VFPVRRENPLGEYRSVYLANTLREDVRRRRTGSGGAVTSLLMYMLDAGFVDAVVASKRKDGLTGEIAIARSSGELLEVAGNRWSVVPFTSMMREALSREGIQRAALVGLPCQAQFIWQMKTFPLLEADFSSKIRLIVSLFCLGTFATEPFLNYLKIRYGIDPSEISVIRMDGKVLEVQHGEETLRLDIRDAISFMQLGCLTCPDYTGIFADLSAGISEEHPQRTILITRSGEAERLLGEAAEAGYLEFEKAPVTVIQEITIKAETKLMRANKYLSMLL